MLDEAKRWFEASTVICRFVPGGKECAEKVRQICPFVYQWRSPLILGTVTDETWADPFKISETYTHLLSRYGPERSGGH